MREDCAFWVSVDENLKTVSGSMMHFRDPDTEDEQKVDNFEVPFQRDYNNYFRRSLVVSDKNFQLLKILKSVLNS